MLDGNLYPQHGMEMQLSPLWRLDIYLHVVLAFPSVCWIYVFIIIYEADKTVGYLGIEGWEVPPLFANVV